MCSEQLSDKGIHGHCHSQRHRAELEDAVRKGVADAVEKSVALLKQSRSHCAAQGKECQLEGMTADDFRKLYTKDDTSHVAPATFTGSGRSVCFGCNHAWRKPPKGHMSACAGKAQHVSRMRFILGVGTADDVAKWGSASGNEMEALRAETQQLKAALQKAKEDAEFYKEEQERAEEALDDERNNNSAVAEADKYRALCWRLIGDDWEDDELEQLSERLRVLKNARKQPLYVSLSADVMNAEERAGIRRT